MAEFVLSVRAYCKMILHLMKYPHCAVNGLFLAEKKKNKEGSSGTVNIVDSVPLFHLNLGLAPMLEAALLQVDSYCKTNGLVIAGYYQANENFKDSNPDSLAFKVAEKISENFGESCLVMVDNERLSDTCDDKAITFYQLQDNKWKQRNTNIKFDKEKMALEVTSALIHSKVYRKLVDFDNHLDNITEDWSNQNINNQISHCL